MTGTKTTQAQARYENFNFSTGIPTNTITDAHLLEKSFRMKGKGVDGDEKRNTTMHGREHMYDYYNVFSTAPGDNMYLNTLHQYSPATDHRPPRFFKFNDDKESSMGWGFENTIEKYATQITIDPCVVEFTGILAFLNNAFDPYSILTAHQGKTPGFMYYLGQATGTISFWPFQILQMGVAGYYFLMNVPPNQFFYCRSAMGAYLNVAQSFFNDLCVTAGYTNPLNQSGSKFKDLDKEIRKMGSFSSHSEPSKDETKNLIDLTPGNDDWDYPSDYDERRLAYLDSEYDGLFNKNTRTIDLTLMLTRGVRKYMKMLDIVQEYVAKGMQITKATDNAAITADDKFSLYRKALSQVTADKVNKIPRNELSLVGLIEAESMAYGNGDDPNENLQSIPSRGENFGKMKNLFAGMQNIGEKVLESNGEYDATTLATENYYVKATTSKEKTDDKSEIPDSTDTISQVWYQGQLTPDKKVTDNVMNLLRIKQAGGYDGINLRVEYQGSVTDSFTNSTSKSQIAEKFNSAAKGAHDVSFDIAGIANDFPLVRSIKDGLQQAIGGFSNSIGITNIAYALFNSAYLRVPDHWSDSTCELHSESYKIELIAPYAHPLCIMTSIYAPLCLLMPLLLPNAAGSSSYTTPFYCKLFAKGRQFIKTGIVGSASIEFGAGGIGFTPDKKPLRCTISFNVINLDNMLTLPMNKNPSIVDTITNPANALKNILFDFGNYNSYLGRLTGLSYLESTLKTPRWRRNWEQTTTGWWQGISSTTVMNAVNDTIIGDIAYAFSNGHINR